MRYPLFVFLLLIGATFSGCAHSSTNQVADGKEEINTPRKLREPVIDYGENLGPEVEYEPITAEVYGLPVGDDGEEELQVYTLEVENQAFGSVFRKSALREEPNAFNLKQSVGVVYHLVPMIKDGKQALGIETHGMGLDDRANCRLCLDHD